MKIVEQAQKEVPDCEKLEKSQILPLPVLVKSRCRASPSESRLKGHCAEVDIMLRLMHQNVR